MPSRAFPEIDLRPGTWHFYLAVPLVLWAEYSIALSMTLNVSVARAMLYSTVPIAGIILMALPTRALILHVLFKLGPAAQAASHVAGALLFAILLYWLRTILNSIALTGDVMNLTLPDFFAPGAAWMLIEGVLYYALIGLVAYIERLRARLATASEGSGDVSADGEAFRLFVRQDDEFRPIDPARIVLARGADDYTEVVTTAGTHLIRMTLATLGERLGPRFIRVHRSQLVNVERIAKAEPAGGGRLLLHMDNGAMITTSRAGARLLRERIV
ncbi:MAG TPA: LytTR family DNA-binding domain-containing protein [Sphingomicrobium sp.]